MGCVGICVEICVEKMKFQIYVWVKNHVSTFVCWHTFSVQGFRVLVSSSQVQGNSLNWVFFLLIPVYTVVVFRSLVVDSWRFASLLKYYAFLVLLSSWVKPNSPIARYICLFVYYLPYNSPFYIIWCMAHFVHVGHDVFDCCPSGWVFSYWGWIIVYGQ